MKKFKLFKMLAVLIVLITSVSQMRAVETIPANTIIYVDVTNFQETDNSWYTSGKYYMSVTAECNVDKTIVYGNVSGAASGENGYWPKGDSEWQELNKVTGNIYAGKVTTESTIGYVSFWRKDQSEWDDLWEIDASAPHQWSSTDRKFIISSNKTKHDDRHVWGFGASTASIDFFTPGSTLFLQVNSNWKTDSPPFAAYFFGYNASQWVMCTQYSGDYYSVTVPEGEWPYVIFVRLKSSTMAWGDAYVHNQTDDIAANGVDNCVTITGWSNSQSFGRYAPTPALSGDFNNWRADADVFDENGEVSVELSANSVYEIKVTSGTTWYGLDNTYVYGQENTYTLNGTQASIKLHTTAVDGTYKFTWDADNSKLSIEYPDVPHPNAGYLYFYNDQGWDPVAAHIWGGSYGTTWGSNPAISSFNWDGDDYYYVAMGDHDNVIFGQGIDNDHKTADLSKSASTLGKFYKKSVTAGWYDFTATLTLSTDQGETTDPSPTTVTVTYGKSTNINTDVLSTSPAHGTYTFGGYYTEPGGAGTQVIGTDEKIPSNLAGYTSSGNWIKTGSSVSADLYAKWTCTITLNNQGADGGKGGTSSVTATYNSSTGLTTITKPQKTGYVFCGYYTLAYGSGKQIIDANGDFNSFVTDYITTGTWTYSSGNVTLYAYWKKASSADQYTFRYYQNGAVAYQVESFVGDGNERTISNFTIPTTEDRFFVGYNEDFWSSGLGEGGTKTSSVRMDWTTAYSETAGVGNGAMKLLPGSSAVGLASGAVGTLKIWTEDAHKNLSVGFLPSGYGVTTASQTLAFTAGADNFYYTDVLTISSTEAAGTFQVKLATSDSYVACAHGTAESAATVSGRKITGDADIANGKKGVFQMWNNSATNNFGLRFVTVYDVTFDMQGHGSAIADYTDVRYNDLIGAPSDPSAVGYTFGGWYKEPACTNEWNFASDVVTAATKLYAKWTANTLTFNGSVKDHETEWNNTGNWSEAIVPTIDHVVVISKPVTVNTNAAKAKSITFTGTGTLTVPSDGALEVAGTITNTTAANIVIQTSSVDYHQGALIFDNSEGATAATVEMKLQYTGSKYQFVAIPVPYVNVSEKFAGKGVYTYGWKYGTGWERRGYYDSFSAFEAVLIKGQSSVDFSGNLVSTNDKSYTGLKYDDSKNYGDVFMFGNSWTAPIKITEGACTNAGISILLGSTNSWDGVSVGDIIPAMQAFAVVVDEDATGSVSFDYDANVRIVTGSNLNTALKAPQRYTEDTPEPITVYVSGNEMQTRIRLFEDETRFSDELDAGWEAYYLEGEGYAGEMYAIGKKKMNILATSNLEGTVVGFVPGQATDYTISFAGDGKGYYLNDVKTGKSTLIEEDNTYEFTSDGSDQSKRFVISKMPMQPTGIEDVVDGTNARKQLIDGVLYIIRDGRIYNVEGALVK